MIETYKLLTGKYDVTCEYFTRGNSNKLLVKRCRYEFFQYLYRKHVE